MLDYAGGVSEEGTEPLAVARCPLFCLRQIWRLAMEYFGILDEIRRYGHKAEAIRRKLESLRGDVYGSHDACRIVRHGGLPGNRTGTTATAILDCQRTYESCLAKCKTLKAEARRLIRENHDPDLMKALYWRQVNRHSWKEVCQKLQGNRSEVAIRQAASRYVRKHSARWADDSESI